MLEKKEKHENAAGQAISGEFLTIEGERYYAIRNVDRMPPFFISVTSNVDHWLFVSSTGGLTAGRVSPETALFPYVPVDKIHDSSPHTGSKTLLRVTRAGQQHCWEPFNREQDTHYSLNRNLYKNVLGNKLRFEEINDDLELAFRYTLSTSDRFGFIKRCEIENLGARDVEVELLDGWQDIMAAGTPRHSQTVSSNLVNAYRWNELLADSGLAIYALYSAISDRAEPLESLKANTVFCVGLDEYRVLLSSGQLDRFRNGDGVEQETLVRGVRGAYFVNACLELGPAASRQWQIVADVDQNQAEIVALRQSLQDAADVSEQLEISVARGSDELARIMAAADGFQLTAEENVSAHHYANVLFNVLRGGIFDNQYLVSTRDLAASIGQFNRAVYERNEGYLQGLPDKITYSSLLDTARDRKDPQLARLCYEYLPITFGRRHGDPSRPWNHFTIKLKDDDGNRLLSYEGNWRDIFQNWEALTFSYPEFIESVIAKFVNASTMDGYNPYRITKQGIDWEVEDPDDPWSYIGYWGDHQIIYLLKLLELSRQFHPERLTRLLHESIFSYANVPYRIKEFTALLEDPKNTVEFDSALAGTIDARIENMGADGKLVLDTNGEVLQVTLLEKLLVPLLAKLGNLVIDGGIWLNTQRPEWNDANNALVGQGLSMVTLYYMRRYVRFLQQLLENSSGPVSLSADVGLWLTDTGKALQDARPWIDEGPVDAVQRHRHLRQLGLAADRYRRTIYGKDSLSGTASLPTGQISDLLEDALAIIDHSIVTNERDDGLYEAYNLMSRDDSGLHIDTLYPMLEGQVAVLSSGAVKPDKAISVVEALFGSDIYRPDQNSFMLYPDRELPGFLDKNVLPAADVEAIPLLQRMLEGGDERLIMRDADNRYRFNAEIGNAGELNARLDAVSADHGDSVEAARPPLQALYENVFHHKAFTGRSGTMFGFEGLGSIYWHMVSKLMLAIEEIYFSAVDDGADTDTCNKLGTLYYRVRDGIGFNKSPSEYGAFPTDPYSHTPKHAGARQPGMTGQVKEEVLCRFAELGIRVNDGKVRINPGLLRPVEFLSEAGSFEYLDVDGNWQNIDVPESGLAFSWCQVPVVYVLDPAADPGIAVLRSDGAIEHTDSLELSQEDSADIFRRSGIVRQLTVTLRSDCLFTA